MGLLDRFRKRFEDVGRSKGVKHAVKIKSGKASAEAEKKRQFAAVPSGKSEVKPAEGAPTKAKAAKTPAKAKATGTAPRVLRFPVVTEKTTRLAGLNQVVFEVSPDATKHAVAQAVRDLYGITPVSVRMVNQGGKAIRYGRATGHTKDKRKAIVQVPPGKRIAVTEGV